MVRPRGCAGKRHLDGRRSEERAELHGDAVQLRTARGMLGDQSICEEGNFEGVSFACKSGEVLRGDIWVEGVECQGCGVGWDGGLF